MACRSIKKSLVILALLFLAIPYAHADMPVYWEPSIDTTTNQCSVKVVSRVRIKDVRCEVVLLDGQNKQIASQSVYVTDNETPELAPEKEYVKTFSTGVSGAQKIEGVLLFGSLALSSPKAAASSNISDELKQGLPPRGAGR
jgi:hypothetical protein